MPPQTNPQNTPLTPTKKKSWFLIVFGILLMLISGYFWWQQSSVLIPPNDPIIKQKQNITVASTTDQFADWKTYRNEEYRFEFQYPKDWYMQGEMNNGPLVFQSTDFSNNIHGIGLPPVGHMRINIAPPEPCKDYDTGFVKQNGNYETEITERVICINNFQITLDLWNKDPNFKKHTQLLNQILSTFKFTK